MSTHASCVLHVATPLHILICFFLRIQLCPPPSTHDASRTWRRLVTVEKQNRTAFIVHREGCFPISAEQLSKKIDQRPPMNNGPCVCGLELMICLFQDKVFVILCSTQLNYPTQYVFLLNQNQNVFWTRMFTKTTTITKTLNYPFNCYNIQVFFFLLRHRDPMKRYIHLVSAAESCELLVL